MPQPITSKEAAERFGVAPSAIRAWATRFKGEFPEALHRYGMTNVYDWTELEAWGIQTGRLPLDETPQKD